VQQQFRYYLGAHGGKSLIWHAYDLLFAYFLTQYLHLPPRTMGMVAMALMVFSAIADPVTGWWIDRGAATLRRLALLQCCGALLSAMAFIALFVLPAQSSPLLHAVVLGLAFQLCYKLYDVPQNAMTSLLSRDQRQVLQLSTGRYVLSGAARILVAGMSYLFIGKDPAHATWNVALFVSLLCAPALLSASLLERMGRQTMAHTRKAPATAATAKRASLRSRIPQGMAMLLIAAFINASMVSVMSRILPYLGAASGALVAFSIGALALLPLLQFIANRFGEHRAFLLATMLVIASCAGLSWSYHRLGPVANVGLDAFAFLYGGAVSGCTMLLWGTAANLIHRHTAKTGQRADTLAYGIFTFASKLGIAWSMMALGQALAAPVPMPQPGDYGAALNSAAMLGITGAVIGAATIHRTMRTLGEAVVPPWLGVR